MKKETDLKRALVVTLVIMGIVIATVYCVGVTKERDALSAKLESVQSVLALTQADLASVESVLASTQVELTSTQIELSSTRTELTSVQTELTSTRASLVSTQANLISTQTELTSTRTELSSTRNTLISAQAELETAQQTSDDLQAELSTAQHQLLEVTQELEVAQETLSGLGITLSTSEQNYDAEMVDDPEAVNPSWDELMSFLSQDYTEKHKYILGVYDCSEFSRDVHNNAEAAGIRGSVVHVDWSNYWVGHALNAFLTTDYGLVYVDCTGDTQSESVDKIARVESGEECREVEVSKISPSNIRNDSWWDGLSSYYIFVAYWRTDSSGHLQPVATVTEDIRIFW